MDRFRRRRSDIRLGISNIRVFRDRSIKPVQVFLNFGSGSGIFSLGSGILDITEKPKHSIK